MKILITNDDGINAEGLKLLVEKAKKYGEILIVAPLYEQSAKSHSICIRRGIKIEENFMFPGVKAYTVDSTPADCVRYARYGLKADFDIVFSGINQGFNLGDDIMYSGTVAGASEGALVGKKAIAFSSYWGGFEGADEFFDEAMNFILKNKLLEETDLLNVNFPKDINGIKITRQGKTHFNTLFVREGDEYFQRGEPHFELEKEVLESDICSVINDKISISPLTIDRTDIKSYNKFLK